MSDLFEARQKVEEGAEWRGEINVVIDDQEYTFNVRQLRDPEFWEVMSKVDTDEIKELQRDLPEEKMEELRELQDAETLDEEESDRLDELREEIEEQDINLFDVLSYETYQGIKQAALYGIEPDERDIQTAMSQYADDIAEEHGKPTNENARQYIHDHEIKPLIEKSTDFTSFAVGVRVFGQTLGDTKN